MEKPHYIVQRSRSGRFNFTLLTSAGRLTGSVVVPIDGRPSDEIKRLAFEQIRVLAEDFARVQVAKDLPPDSSPAEPVEGLA